MLFLVRGVAAAAAAANDDDDDAMEVVILLQFLNCSKPGITSATMIFALWNSMQITRIYEHFLFATSE